LTVRIVERALLFAAMLLLIVIAVTANDNRAAAGGPIGVAMIWRYGPNWAASLLLSCVDLYMLGKMPGNSQACARTSTTAIASSTSE
jgi:hypothetical protein